MQFLSDSYAAIFLILEANLEAGPHVKVLSFWSSFPLEKLGRKDNTLYGLVQAPWNTMKNHEPQSDTLKESRTIKRTWTQSSKPSNNISNKDERNNVKEKPSSVSMSGTVIWHCLTTFTDSQTTQIDLRWSFFPSCLHQSFGYMQ